MSEATDAAEAAKKLAESATKVVTGAVDTPKVPKVKSDGTWEVVIVFVVICVAIFAVWYFTREKKPKAEI